MKALIWSGEAAKGEMYDTVEIPATHAEAAARVARQAARDARRERRRDDGAVPRGRGAHRGASSSPAIRRATIASKLNPVLCGSAFKNKGVQPLLDAVVGYLPSPLDVDAIEGHAVGDEDEVVERQPNEDEPFSALAFKIMSDPHLGKLTYIRVYSGTLETGTAGARTAPRAARSGSARSTRCTRTSVRRSTASGAGDIVAVMGLKDTTTGDTLCDPTKPGDPRVDDFPAPVIHVAIEPKTKGDQEKLGTAIQRLAEEDPTFQVRTDEETGQTIIAGMGELHLEVLVDRMRREFNVEANVGKPQVAYRETIRKTVEKVDYTHKKQTGGSGQFAKVIIDIEPHAAATATAATSSSTRSPVAASRGSTSRRSTRAARRPWSSASSPATRWSTSR